jgi:hypothetical protein
MDFLIFTYLQIQTIQPTIIFSNLTNISFEPNAIFCKNSRSSVHVLLDVHPDGSIYCQKVIPASFI